MSRKTIDKYCKAVGRQLICLAGTRQELLKGLRAELEELPPKQTESLEKLEVHCGKPPHMAEELQEAVSPEERVIALERQRRRRLLIGIAAGALILLLAVYIVLLLKSWPAYFVTDPPVNH